MSDASKSKAAPVVDPRILEPFIASSRSVFERQTGFVLETGEPRVRDPRKDRADIGAVVRLNNDLLEGKVGIFFNQRTFLHYYDLAAGVSHKEIVPEIYDAAFEILNMVYSAARAALILKGLVFERQMPMILVGENLSRHLNRDENYTLVPFNGPMGEFYLEIFVGKKGLKKIV